MIDILEDQLQLAFQWQKCVIYEIVGCLSVVCPSLLSVRNCKVAKSSRLVKSSPWHDY